MMRKTTRASNRASISLLFAALTAAPLMADPGEEAPDAPEVSDSPTERLPAITTFPRYPSLARRDRIEGEATVCFKIAPNGRILDPFIKSSTHEIFEEPALRAIEASSFEPLATDEELSGTETCRTFRFRLDPVAA